MHWMHKPSILTKLMFSNLLCLSFGAGALAAEYKCQAFAKGQFQKSFLFQPDAPSEKAVRIDDEREFTALKNESFDIGSEKYLFSSASIFNKKTKVKEVRTKLVIVTHTAETKALYTKLQEKIKDGKGGSEVSQLADRIMADSQKKDVDLKTVTNEAGSFTLGNKDQFSVVCNSMNSTHSAKPGSAAGAAGSQ